MSIHEILALVLIIAGSVVALIASIGLVRFPDVLTRMHAASKPQTLGLMLITLGVAIAWWRPEAFGLMLLVLLAQMITVPVSSTMIARSAFRRGFVRGGDYAVDELSPRLARSLDEDDDEDGFVDEEELEEPGGFADGAARRFPENVVHHAEDADLSSLRNWDEPEPVPTIAPEELDVDEEAIIPPEEEQAPPAGEDRRARRSSRRRRGRPRS